MDPYDEDLTVYIVVGYILSFILAFGVGANDVANSFGTSVGSGVLTLRKACILATIFETLGAVLIGYKVSDTVRKGILDVSLYNNTETELMLGFISALGGSAVWNIVATFFKLPISGTHSIVGATVGFTLCARGFEGVNWTTFGKIVASWFISPVLSGLTSAVLYLGIKRFILKKKNPLEPGLRALPFFYGFTFFVNVFSIVHNGPHILMFHQIPWWGALVAASGVSLVIGLLIQCIMVPHQRKAVQKHLDEVEEQKNTVKFTFGSADNSRSSTPPNEPQKDTSLAANDITYGLLSPNSKGYVPIKTSATGALDPSLFKLNNNAESEKLQNGKTLSEDGGLSSNSSQVPLVPSGTHVSSLNMDAGHTWDAEKEETDRPEVGKLFSFLQVLTATFGSFAHGGNDVSNAIGPLIALWAIYTEGCVSQKSETPIYLLLYGGLGISVGLWIWGRRVIQTIGEDLTKVTPSSGFTIEIGSAFTVLLASKVGLPISTTHCKVGSVVFVGWSKSSRQGVDWHLFRNIVIAWVVTVPLTAGISALLMFILRVCFL